MSILPKRLSQQFKYWQDSCPKRGFTLIELLVAISIIAILSAVGMVAYSTAQRSARDSKRKQDLKSISIALQLYYQKNREYPYNAAYAWWKSTNTTTSSWIPGLTSEYIGIVPNDPISNGGTPWTNTYGYVYIANDDPVYGCPPAGQWYTMMALLEGSNDKYASQTQNLKYCDGNTSIISAIPTLSSGRTFVVTSGSP